MAGGTLASVVFCAFLQAGPPARFSTRFEASSLFPVPDSLVRTTVALRGAEGLEWLDRLPSIVADCERRWEIRVRPPFTPLSYNYAAPAVRAGGMAAVLKVCFPDREFLAEAGALRLFGGHGMARLLEADLDQGALLLEHLRPGTPLESVEDDQEATAIAAAVLRQLWRPPPPDHQFPFVADWGTGFVRLRAQFEGGSGPLPAVLVDEAETLFAELLASQAAPVLLHGDLHHGNILATQREPWLAIDPKGVAGEAAYDTGALLRNPAKLLAASQPGRILARRVDQLAEELGLDRARVRGWGLAQAVLAAYWSLEDNGHVWRQPLVCAELLAAIHI